MPGKVRYQKRKELGLCTHCGTRPNMENHILCVRCSAIQDQHGKSWYKKNKTKKDAYSRKEFNRRKNEGLCTTCGSPKYPDIDDGYSKCINCREELHAVNF